MTHLYKLLSVLSRRLNVRIDNCCARSRRFFWSVEAGCDLDCNEVRLKCSSASCVNPVITVSKDCQKTIKIQKINKYLSARLQIISDYDQLVIYLWSSTSLDKH